MTQSDRTTVEAQYTWDGKLSAYRRTLREGVQFVPIDPANSDYLRLLADIKDGVVNVVMQQPSSAFPVYSRDGTQTGFDTDIGFVPCDADNPKYVLLAEAIAEGRCKLSTQEAPSVDEGDFVAELVVCVLFNQAWPNVVESYTGDLSVRPSARSAPKPFRFVIRNLVDLDSKSGLELLLTAHGCVNREPLHQSRGIPAGVLEISIPVADLRKILKGQVSVDTSQMQPFLRDMIDMELVRTGRTATDGPSIQWLVDNAHNYLNSFVSDFSNRIVEAFWNEYGGTPMTHVSPFSLQRQSLILRRTRSGKFLLGSWISIGPQAFALSGHWNHPVGLDAVSDAPVGYQGRFQRALSRLRMLIESGFHMEAVVLVNSILEVSISSSLCQCAMDDPSLAERIRQLGHHRRMEILSELVQVRETSPISAGIAEYLHTAFELYALRNNYVHDLEFPEKGAVLSHREQLELHRMLQHFADPWRQQGWFRWLASIAIEDSDARRLLTAACK